MFMYDLQDSIYSPDVIIKWLINLPFSFCHNPNIVHLFIIIDEILWILFTHLILNKIFNLSHRNINFQSNGLISFMKMLCYNKLHLQQNHYGNSWMRKTSKRNVVVWQLGLDMYLVHIKIWMKIFTIFHVYYNLNLCHFSHFPLIVIIIIVILNIACKISVDYYLSICVN